MMYEMSDKYELWSSNNLKANVKYLILTVTVFLSGCASAPQQYWVHQNKSQQQFYQDNSQCASMANSGGNMYQNVPNTGKPFDTSELQNTLGQIDDQNRRRNIQNQCMYGKGWSLKAHVESNKVTASSKRSTKSSNNKRSNQKWSHWSKSESDFTNDSTQCTATSGARGYDVCMQKRGWYFITY